MIIQMKANDGDGMGKKSLSHQETAWFCRSLALLIQAGIGLGDGIFLMAEEEEGQSQNFLNQLGSRLDQGLQLSETLEESGVFPGYVIGMVQVGERTGRMEQSLMSLAAYYEDRCRINRMMRSALAYPSMILLLMLAVIAVLLIKVLPVFDQVYVSLGSRLTGVAAGLLHLGQFLEAVLPVLLGLLTLGAVLVLLFSCWSAFREGVLSVWRRRFGDRGVSGKFNNAQFARALAMGLSSGLPLEESVDLAQMLLADIPDADSRCRKCAGLLKEGASLADALGNSGFLPAASCRMLTVGLRGGNGDQVMTQIADRLMEDAGQALEDGVSRVEPAMVLIASLLVGVILLSVMLPLTNIMSSIG